MKKILLILLISCNFAFAYFMVDDNYNKQVQVLKSLDIDISFLHDDMLINLKDDITQRQAHYLVRVLENGAEFVPVLKKMIQDAGIPDAFLYLAMAESEFSANAYSKAKASGLWQFMAPTALKFGLEIDDYVDERRDPIKSTEAAIVYLQTLHDRFDKWYLAAMAYNCGEGRVQRAINAAGTDDLKVLLDEQKKYLPAETRNYIRKIIAMANLSQNTNFILENGASYLLNSGVDAGVFEKVEIKGGASLDAVADAINIPLKELLSYNSHLNYFFTPPNKEKYHIYIPHNKQMEFANNFNDQGSKLYLYVVKAGDTFNKIAREYKIPYKVIKDFNGLESNNLRVGQKLFIPAIEEDDSPNIEFASLTTPYTIQNGDTLLSISTKYNVDVKALMHANNLKDTSIYTGGKLEIPKTF